MELDLGTPRIVVEEVPILRVELHFDLATARKCVESGLKSCDLMKAHNRCPR